jgi:hypothetical protein
MMSLTAKAKVPTVTAPLTMVTGMKAYNRSVAPTHTVTEVSTMASGTMASGTDAASA